MTAANKASKLYKEKIPIKKQSAKVEWEKMANDTVAIVKSFRKNKFHKMLAEADPTHEDDFMVEACSYANFLKIIVICFNYLGFDLWIYLYADK